MSLERAVRAKHLLRVFHRQPCGTASGLHREHAAFSSLEDRVMRRKNSLNRDIQGKRRNRFRPSGMQLGILSDHHRISRHSDRLRIPAVPKPSGKKISLLMCLRQNDRYLLAVRNQPIRRPRRRAEIIDISIQISQKRFLFYPSAQSPQGSNRRDRAAAVGVKADPKARRRKVRVQSQCIVFAKRFFYLRHFTAPAIDSAGRVDTQHTPPRLPLRV